MSAMYDALIKTEKGRSIVFQVTTQKAGVESRKRQVISLIEAVFPNQPDVLHYARCVRSTAEVIKSGGPSYQKLINAIEYGSVDQTVALKALGL